MAKNALAILALAAALIAAGYTRSPYLISVRGFEIPIVLALGAIACLAKKRWWTIGGAVIAGVIALHHQARFENARELVLSAPQEQLERLGKHVMIGYRDPEALKALAEKKAFGGLYVTHRNVRDRSIGAVRAELLTLTGGRRLLIAADQEGGPVSRLSPPLQEKPPLSAIYTDQVEAYAADQARGLSSLGVNVNFAPVIDLRHPIEPSWFDLHTRISDRAISDRPEIVAETAETYAKTLIAHGVAPTFKHFPGLGRVPEDTHHFPAELETARGELERTDWIPFHRAAQLDPSLIMIGHVVLSDVDPETTALRSREVVQGILRHELGFKGVLVTDDLCMAPAFHGPGEIEQAAVDAIHAGVDLLLVSYDGDQYYRVLAALIEAENKGLLSRDELEESARRLDRISERVFTIATN